MFVEFCLIQNCRLVTKSSLLTESLWLDVVSESVKKSPMYDVEKEKRQMGECERFTCSTRPSLASLDTEEAEESEDEEMEITGARRKANSMKRYNIFSLNNDHKLGACKKYLLKI